MTDPILDIHHPVPFRLVPARGRSERTCHLSVSTPVRAVRVDPAAMRQVGHAYRPLVLGRFQEDTAPVLHEGEGRLWARLCRQSGTLDGNRNRVPVTVGEFIACFAGPEARLPGWLSDWSTLRDRCLGTPLVAWSPPERDSDKPYSKGATLRGLRALPRGRVVDDCLDEARVALAAMFERHVRLAGDGVYLSVEGPHHVAEQSFEGAFPSSERLLQTVIFPRAAVLRRPHSVPSAPLPRHGTERYLVPSGRRDLAGAFMSRCVGFRPSDLLLPDQHVALSARASGNDGLAIHANEMPARLLRLAATWSPIALRVDLAPLRPRAARGTVGAIPAEDAAEVLALCARMVEAVAVAHPALCKARSPAAMMLAYHSEVAVPALADLDREPPSEEDDMAMSGMAP